MMKVKKGGKEKKNERKRERKKWQWKRQTDRQIDRKYVSNKESKITDTGKSE